MRESLRKWIGVAALVAGTGAIGSGAASLLYQFVTAMLPPSGLIKPLTKDHPVTLEEYCLERERIIYLEEVGGMFPRSYEVHIPRPKIPRYNFEIRPGPSAGKSIELLVKPYSPDLIPLAAVNLYEDDKLIEEKEVSDNAPEVYFEVDHDTRGRHTYVAEVVDACGGKARSEAKTITFSGVSEDSPPRIGAEYNLGFWVGLGNRTLVVDAYDFGDNRGLDRILIYEDNKPIAVYDGKKESHARIEYPIIELRSLVLTGTHAYAAEAIDISGQVFRTKEISITFKGK